MIPAKRKVFYIISNVHKSLAFECTLQGLQPDYDLTVVLLNPAGSAMEDFLNEHGIAVVRMPYHGKFSLPKVILWMCWLFTKERPAVVHTHLFDATLAGLAAAWITAIHKRIYTRHNSTFHHLYFPTAVKYDRLSNRMATDIISISQSTDKALLQLEGVPANKLHKIRSGFELKAFGAVDEKRVLAVKEKWGIPISHPCVGVIARHVEWKGIQFITPAFTEFLKSYPEACLILANATGPYHGVIMDLLNDIPSKNVVIIPFEEDIAALYKLFDVYVHTPIDSSCEAFGQTYVEALASGIPSVFTLSGIAAEFIQHEKNALVVDFKNTMQIHDALIRVSVDPVLRTDLIEEGRESVDPAYTISLMLHRLKELYDA